MLSRRRFLAGSLAAPFANSLSSLLVQGANTKIPLIDSHVHVWKHDPAFPFAPGAQVPPQDASVEMLLGLMKANGVARTVIIQVIHYRWDNSYVADVSVSYTHLDVYKRQP